MRKYVYLKKPYLQYNGNGDQEKDNEPLPNNLQGGPDFLVKQPPHFK